MKLIILKIEVLMFPKRNENRTVFSTESGRICPNCGKPVQKCVCTKVKQNSPIKQDGIVRIRLERKGRGGKSVTLVEGLPMKDDLLKELATELKKHCGVGGSIKNGTIELQGDVRDAAMLLLKEKNLQVKKAGG